MPVLNHSGWAVTSLDPNAYITNAAGDQVTGVRVGFQTNAGNSGSVFVADTLLSEDNVIREVSQRAALMDTVASLEQPAGGIDV